MRKLVWLCVTFLAFAIPASAQDNPKAEVFGGYSYLHTSVLGTGFNSNGASGSIAVNPNDWFGVVADVGVYHHSTAGVGVNTVSYLFGPKFAYRKHAKVTPYFQTLFGGAHVGASFGGLGASANAFAWAFGGGLDAKIASHVAIRVIQVEYVMTKFNDGVDNRQNNVRVSTGIVFRWGGK